VSDFAAFALSFGGVLALMALIAAWLFRTASAPLWVKVAIPALMVALTCYMPWAVNDMLGYPVDVRVDQLPERAELVAFVPRDDEKRVDLWLVTDAPPSFGNSGGPGPRAYETILTSDLKKTLREAQQAIGRGGRAVLMKRGADSKIKAAGQDALAIGDDQEMYVLDPGAISNLPPKE
jgi:hypothetical protein